MGYNDKWELFSEKYKYLCTGHDVIPDSLFKEYGVNRGLRDINGNGVLTGLTNISRIDSFRMENGQKEPCDGKLWYMVIMHTIIMTETKACIFTVRTRIFPLRKICS